MWSLGFSIRFAFVIQCSWFRLRAQVTFYTQALISPLKFLWMNEEWWHGNVPLILSVLWKWLFVSCLLSVHHHHFINREKKNVYIKDMIYLKGESNVYGINMYKRRNEFALWLDDQLDNSILKLVWEWHRVQITLTFKAIFSPGVKVMLRAGKSKLCWQSFNVISFIRTLVCSLWLCVGSAIASYIRANKRYKEFNWVLVSYNLLCFVS